ncbi:MAG TPA: hypothetical protein VFI22_00020, partial [Thermomicrobiales bacterium]|nr:hypothetical protein [Thermomicrobiales bacterium]
CANGTCVPEVGTTCCSGERLCDGRFCIPGDQCCFVTERDCPDGSCVAKDACCPNQRKCPSGECVANDACCPDERQCDNDGCIPQDACCPNVETPCASANGGCCNSAAGETCSDDGCCNVLLDKAVCGGKCVDLGTNDNCSQCGDRCGSCKTCRADGQAGFVCAAPDAAPPACQTCVAGEVVTGVSCGDRCCGAGAECCGGGCCGAGKCRVADNGETCCLKVVDNHQICLVM